MINLGKVLILGDSYSTFEGYIPDGYDSWYYKDIKQDTDVNRVEQTWWKMLLESTRSELALNCSWSGTPICHSGYGGDWSSSSFITRFDQLVQDGFFMDRKIDTVFLFGGTNDSWANSPIGELLFSDWTREDLFSVLPAFCYLLNRMKQFLPHARIICIINTELKQEITDGFKVVCDKFGVESIKLQDIEKCSGHPNKVGMRQIYEQVLGYLKKYGFS